LSLTPIEPRPAATVVLLRPGPAGLEALLTRRPSSMAFAAGMHVFPGGRVDPGDFDPDIAARSVLSPSDCMAALGGGGDLTPWAGIAAHVAAIRELFEEAGVLLAEARGDGVSLPLRAVSRARSALVEGKASFASIVLNLDIRLRTDWLVPLSRWVTPPILPRRFDTRFFAASVPDRARISFEGDEVESHAWFTPTSALDAMTAGEVEMWVPTSATLQQLEYVASIDEIRRRLSPRPLGRIEVERVSPQVTRIVMPAGGGVAGQPVCAYLVGRSDHVLIDPGDPTGPALDAATAVAAARGGSIVGIALTHADPDHAGGAEGLAEQLDVPIFAGPGAGRRLPYAVRELADAAILPAGDVRLRAVWTPGPRPDHLAFLVGDPPTMVVYGDLDGERGARSVCGPPDHVAAAASRARLQQLAPGAARLGGHPPSARRRYVPSSAATRDRPVTPRRGCAGC